MRSPASRVLTLGFISIAAVLSCGRETPLQPMRADVTAASDSLPPSNDARDSARFAFPLPYSDTADLRFATVEPGEPTYFCHDSVTPPTRSVWYGMTANQPGGQQLTAQLFSGPGVLTVYAVHSDSTGIALLPVGCSAFNQPVTFQADSGTFFYYQVTDSAGAGTLTVFTLQGDTVAPPPPPANDYFADARMIPGVPYSDTAFFTGASREFNEPAYCAFQSRTVWYRFTPTQTQTVQYGLTSTPYYDVVTVYQGVPPDTLAFVGCANSFSPGSFTAFAGQTYYFQVSSDQDGGAVFFLNQPPPPPPPQANFATYPYDPSSFDNTQFYDQSYDPGGIGFQSYSWSFGDGATASGYNVTHRYAADGDYTVVHGVTTYDGRTDSIVRVVQVRTHDVAITRFATPATGMTGKTTKISVDIRSNRYPETVQVQLFKSVPGGYQQVASTIQTLPTRNRVTTVGFTYTFTSDDAAIGKVTFRAVVTLFGARDALPADNEAIGSPTRVTR